MSGVRKSQGKKEHININKWAGLSWDWVGGKDLFICFFGSFLMGEKKHINKIPPKSQDNPVKHLFTCFFFMCFFAFQKGVLSKRVALADVPLFRNFLQKRSFSVGLPWQKKATILIFLDRKSRNECTFAQLLFYRRVPPCVVKTCAVRPVFARVVGELRAADPSNVQGPVKQHASPGVQSEAPRPR